MARKTHREIISLFESLAAKTARGPLGCCIVAKRVWRTRRHPHAAGYLLGRDGASGSAADGQRAWSGADWTDDYRVWDGGAEATVYRQNPQCGRDLVPGIFRTKRRLGS